MKKAHWAAALQNLIYISYLNRDDILSAVDAHTSAALMDNLFQGELVKSRTVLLVSHHIQLVSPAADYIVCLDNGDVKYAGDLEGFAAAGLMETLVEQTEEEKAQENEQDLIDKKLVNKRLALTEKSEPSSETSSIADTEETVVPSSPSDEKTRKPRKLIEDEQKATGGISGAVWRLYLAAQGGPIYWALFVIVLLVGALPPLVQNTWLRLWSSSYTDPESTRSPAFYVGVYCLIAVCSALAENFRFLILYMGSLSASRKISKLMLERVLLASIRYHGESFAITRTSSADLSYYPNRYHE